MLNITGVNMNENSALQLRNIVNRAFNNQDSAFLLGFAVRMMRAMYNFDRTAWEGELGRLRQFASNAVSEIVIKIARGVPAV